MKRIIHTLLLLSLFTGTGLKAQTKKTISDFYTNTKLGYTENYIELKNNRFNLFDELGVQYPVLEGNAKLNKKLYYYCVQYMQTDSFKLEFLQKANLAGGLFLNRDGNRYNYDVNTWNNRDNFLPMIKDFDYHFSFLYDQVLALQLTYTYDLGPDMREEFKLVKQLFISLKDGNVYTLEQVLAPEKRAAFGKRIHDKALEVFASAKQDDENAPVSEESDGEEEDMSGDNPSAKNRPVLINELQFIVNPFSCRVLIPELSANSELSNGRGLQLNFQTEELKQYINVTGPLRNLIFYSKIHSTSLRNYNMELELIGSNWQSAYNVHYDGVYNRPAPAPGIRTIIRRISYRNEKGYVQHIKTFAADGKPLKEEVFDSGQEKPNYTRVLEYNMQGLISKVTEYNHTQLRGVKTFVYDHFNNLIEKTQSDERGRVEVSHYYYDGYTIYEDIENSEDDEPENSLREFHLNPDGKLICVVNAGGECYGEALFDKGKPMANFNPLHPNLDNVIYAYDTKGNLLTCERDNGRHLHELLYNAAGNVEKVIYTESGTVKDIWQYTYNAEGLLEKEVIRSGLYDYDYSRNENTHIYTFEYIYY